MGLYTAEQFKPSEFFIYSKCENVSFFNLEILILGPYSSHCRTTVLQYLVRKSKTKNIQKIIESSPESINIQVELDKDRVKISYVTRNCGIHEISLSCNKENIMGSPFYVNVMKYTETKSTYKKRKDSAVQTEDLEIISKKIDETSNEISEKNINDVDNDSTTTIEKNSHDMNKEATPKHKTPIGNSQTLEISKYLKDLNNSREKEVNTAKSLLTNKDEMCPNFYTKENYSYFQKLVNSAFRKTCRITRASPRLCQKMFPQFSYASPVCRDHIVPEGFRKLSADEKRKVSFFK